IDPEDMDAAAVPGWQVDLGRQHIAERRAERADIRHERTIGPARLRVERADDEWRRPRQSGRSPQEQTAGGGRLSHGDGTTSMVGGRSGPGAGRRGPCGILTSRSPSVDRLASDEYRAALARSTEYGVLRRNRRPYAADSSQRGPCPMRRDPNRSRA